MCTYNYLERIILLVSFLILTSCSEGAPGSRPSLNADDLWDRMDEERQKPLPEEQENSQAVDSREILSDSLPVTSPEPLSIADIEGYRAGLRTAGDNYQAIADALNAGFAALEVAGGNARDRQDGWRTMQLYLSRLKNLQKMMDGAINILEGAEENGFENQSLLTKSRDLLAVIADRIDRTRSRLDDLAPHE